MNYCHLCPSPAPQGEPLCAACFDAAFDKSWNASVARLKDPRRVMPEADRANAIRYMEEREAFTSSLN
jgi:hypothetical protein